MIKAHLKIEYMKGTGPGGQRKNKVQTACKITHIPSGLSSYSDQRSQRHSYKEAMADLEKKVKREREEKRAAAKKARRDHAIHNTKTIRTYDFKRQIVKDHRSGKKASIKDVLIKGKIELMRPDNE